VAGSEGEGCGVEHGSVVGFFYFLPPAYPSSSSVPLSRSTLPLCSPTSSEMTSFLENRSKIPFLEITEEQIRLSTETNIVAATAFSQAAIRAFLAGGDDKGGTIIFTGATSAWRGREEFGAFAAGKHGLRAISQVRRAHSLLCPYAHSLLSHAVHRPRIRSTRSSLGFRRSFFFLPSFVLLQLTPLFPLSLLAGARWRHHHRQDSQNVRL
jgi:hypothetical protein